jgi:Flp pilus assembly protein TadG
MTRRRNHNERGQSVVEFALVLPLLCMVVFGIVQFGIVYNDYITLTDAARVGARKAAVSRQTSDPVGLAEAAIRRAAPDLDPLDLEILVDAPVWAPGADVTVETSYPYEVNIMGLVVASGRLRSEVTERIE